MRDAHDRSGCDEGGEWQRRPGEFHGQPVPGERPPLAPGYRWEQGRPVYVGPAPTVSTFRTLADNGRRIDKSGATEWVYQAPEHPVDALERHVLRPLAERLGLEVDEAGIAAARAYCDERQLPEPVPGGWVYERDDAQRVPGQITAVSWRPDDPLPAITMRTTIGTEKAGPLSLFRSCDAPADRYAWEAVASVPVLGAGVRIVEYPGPPAAHQVRIRGRIEPEVPALLVPPPPDTGMMEFQGAIPSHLVAMLDVFADQVMTRRGPSVDIGRRGSPYIDRWYLARKVMVPLRSVGPDYLDLPPFVASEVENIYLHRYHRGDADEPHDHPWPNASMVVRGWYREDIYSLAGEKIGTRTRWPGDIVLRSSRSVHAIVEVEEGTLSLFATLPKERDWGYHTAEGWVPWREREQPVGS